MTDTTARGTLAATADRRLIRATHHSTRYVLVELVAPPATGERKRPRVNVSFVLEKSRTQHAVSSPYRAPVKKPAASRSRNCCVSAASSSRRTSSTE